MRGLYQWAPRLTSFWMGSASGSVCAPGYLPWAVCDLSQGSQLLSKQLMPHEYL